MSKTRKAATIHLSDDVMRAVHRKDYLLLEQLVTNSTVNLTTSAGRSLLSMVVSYGDTFMLEWLLTKHPDLDQQDPNGWTALHFAAQAYAMDKAELLVQAGATVDRSDAYGNTPLWRAVFEARGRGDMLRLLLTHGANPLHQNHSGISPLQLADTIANYDIKQFFAH